MTEYQIKDLLVMEFFLKKEITLIVHTVPINCKK